MTIQSILPNAAKETTTTQGTGDLSLSGASTGFQAFSAAVGDGAQVCYAIEQLTLDSNGNITDAVREVGLGTLTHGSPDTLSRDTIFYSTNGGSAVNLGTGTKDVFAAPAGELIPMMTTALTANKEGRPLIVNSTSTAFEVGNPSLGQQALSELTISSGAVTPTRAAHTVDTESDASTDDLSSAATTNIADGGFLLITAANTARTVVVKHNGSPSAGQFYLLSGADYSLDDDKKSILFQRRGTYWVEVSRAASYGADIVDNGSGDLAQTTNYVEKTDTDYTITESEWGYLVVSAQKTTGRTFTLPALSGTTAGFRVGIGNFSADSYDLTLAANGSDVIYGPGSNATSQTLRAGDIVWLVARSSGWRVESGSVTATTSQKGSVELSTSAEVTSEAAGVVPTADILKYHQGIAKAWVNFTGTGTVAINDSYNVSSITDNGTGDYTANLGITMANANYAYALGGVKSDGNIGIAPASAAAITTTAFGIKCFSGTAYDSPVVSLTIFGDI